MRRLQTVQRALRGLRFGTVWRDLEHLLPRLGRALQVLFAKGLDDADVEERLGVLRIELERTVEQLERLVRPIRVVVADAEIGDHVDVVWRERERLVVPFDGVFVTVGVEIESRELRARLGVLRLALGNRLEGCDLRLVEHRGAGRGRRRRVRHLLLRRRRRAARALLRADDPAGNQTEQNAGDSEGNGVRFHEKSYQLSAVSYQLSALIAHS